LGRYAIPDRARSGSNNTAYRPVIEALELLARYAGVDGKVRF
jgi:hypothetical protein